MDNSTTIPIPAYPTGIDSEVKDGQTNKATTIVNHSGDESGLTRPMPDDRKTLDDGGLTRPMPDDRKTLDDGGLTRPMPDDWKTLDDGGLTRPMPDDRKTLDDGVTSPLFDDQESLDDGVTGHLPDAEKPQFVPNAAEANYEAFEIGCILQQRYRLDRILGKGGFGAAYLAQDIKLKRACVIKQMLIPHGTSPHEIAIYRANFEREASLLVQLNHPGHPNIPEIYDYFSETSGNYLVMKYIEGHSLKDVLDKAEGKILWREAVRYTMDVCGALNYMHTLSNEPIMHRDIKPANILLGNDRRVWLVDFGLAKAKPVEDVTGNMLVTKATGTVGYTPFEQWLGQATSASDIYALGVTLHYLVTGLNPIKAFKGEFHVQKIQEQHGHLIPIRQVDKDLPKGLEGIIMAATAAEPSQRPTAQQLQRELDGLISGAQEAGLFTFKSGEAAQTIGVLVDLCEKYRREAEAYLYNGDFERWFVIINRNDLAEAAVQAVKHGKNQPDGLEKFLKLIMPNLLLRRLGKLSWQLTRTAVQFIFIFMVVVLLVATASSYIVGWFIQRSIAGYPWDYSALDINHENQFTEKFLTKKFQNVTAAYLDDLQVDVHRPDGFDIHAIGSGVQLHLPITLRLEDKKPHFYLTHINDIPLYLLATNISYGINRGVDAAFQAGPLDVTQLEAHDTAIVFKVNPSGRAPFIKPRATPLPTPTPPPHELTLVAVFNRLDREVILEIDGETWRIAASDTKVIEKMPGTYNFTVRYSENGQLAKQGTVTWTLKAYRWYIKLKTD